MVNYINWWDKDSGAHDAFTYIIKYCSKQYTNFDLSKIFIYSLFGPLTRLKEHSKNVDGVKIYFTGENTRQRFTEYKDESDISNFVDIVCSFFTTTEKSIRFPLWLLYYKFYSEGLFTPKDPENGNRHFGASLISRHDAHNNRVPFVYKFLYNKVPVYSTLPIPGTYGVSLGPECNDKVNFIKNLYFNICCENTIEEGYTTEKIFHCIEAGCIPIYNGIRPVEEGILNQERIYSDITPELIQNTTSIQKMDIWDKDALVNIFLIYLSFWIKVKTSYTLKYGELNLKEESVKDAIIYTFDTYDKEVCRDKIKEHWRIHKQLFEPLALIQVKNKLYTIEDIFSN